VTKEVVHHAGLRVDGRLHLRFHVCKVIHPSLKSFDPFHRTLSLVNPITDVLLQRSVPVRVPSRGRGSSSEARLGVTVRGIVTTTLMVTQVANPIPSVPLGLMWVSLWCSHGMLCCHHTSSPASAGWPAGHKSLARQLHLASTQLPLSFFSISCSSHAHSTDQKHQQ
jgi:hypothetical protein